MRLLLRLGIAFAVLCVLALVGLAVVLPRLASNEAVRARLQATAREATGQEVGWADLAFGLLPPRLVVHRPTISEPGSTGPPRLEAERVDLRLALLPLLTRTVVIDSLVLDGVTVRVVRTPEGIELPIDLEEGAPEEDAPREGAPAEAVPEPTESPVRLAVRQVRLQQSRVIVEDRAVEPAVTWDLGDVDLSARGDSLEGPIDVQLSGRLASGGALRVTGSVTMDASIDLGLQIDALAVEPAAPYLGAGQRIAGVLSGDIQASGPAASPTRLTAQLALADGQIEAMDVVLNGAVALRADLEGGLESPSGTFEVDATDADLAYGEAFKKPRGKMATVAGRLVPGPDGSLALDDVKLRLANLDATARVRTGDRMRVEIDAPPFELAGWEELLPALDVAPQGRVSLEKLALATEPFEVGGGVRFDEVRVTPPGRAPLELRGALMGEGSAVRGQGLEVVVGGERAEVDVEVTDLAGAPRYAVRVRTEQAEANSLLEALADMGDTLYGPLTTNASFSGPVGGERSPLEAVSGEARLDIGKGKLQGVSLLRSTFERFGAFGEAALIVGALRGGKTLQRFYGDEFESITGSFRIADGRARTDDLRLVYRHYTVDLKGSLGLVDERLDFTGKLTIDEEVDAALAEASEEEGGAAPTPKQRVIPLARVVGTVSEPRVDLSRGAVVAFAASYATAGRLEPLQEKIDERLGEGAGREILDTLEGILGGRPKPPKEPREE
jgi:AsmA protein